MDNETLAMELLRELKTSAKHWFIAFCIMVGVEIATIAGFLWYISLPVEETTIEQDADDYSDNTIIGGDNYGSKTEGNVQEESNTQ